MGHNAVGQVKGGGKLHRKKGQALEDEQKLMDNMNIFLGQRDSSEDGGSNDGYESRCEHVHDTGQSTRGEESSGESGTTRGGESSVDTGGASSDDGRTDKTACVGRGKKRRTLCKYMCCSCFQWTTNFSQHQRRKTREIREQHGIVCVDYRKILDAQ